MVVQQINLKKTLIVLVMALGILQASGKDCNEEDCYEDKNWPRWLAKFESLCGQYKLTYEDYAFPEHCRVLGYYCDGLTPKEAIKRWGKSYHAHF